MTDQDLRDIRRDYGLGELSRQQLDRDPLTQFSLWLSQALEANLVDATAMTLATVDNAGQPNARIVLLKQHDQAGFSWYTSYASAKGAELQDNPRATLLFYWRELERQVRITGTVKKVARKDTEEYFNSRPQASRYAAAASQQSSPIESRAALQSRVDALQDKYPQGNVPTPGDWGGYILEAAGYEFWQGRESRLHDRFQYTYTAQAWHLERLQP